MDISALALKAGYLPALCPLRETAKDALDPLTDLLDYLNICACVSKRDVREWEKHLQRAPDGAHRRFFQERIEHDGQCADKWKAWHKALSELLNESHRPTTTSS